MMTSYTQNTSASLVCTKLFTSSGHHYCNTVRMWVMVFFTSLFLWDSAQDFPIRGLVVKSANQMLSRIRAIVVNGQTSDVKFGDMCKWSLIKIVFYNDCKMLARSLANFYCQ